MKLLFILQFHEVIQLFVMSAVVLLILLREKIATKFLFKVFQKILIEANKEKDLSRTPENV